MEWKAFPLCTGPCPRGSWNELVYETLHEQQRGAEMLREEILRRRLRSLTPDRMRTELAMLGNRIEAAHGR